MELLRYNSWSAAPGTLPRQGYLSCLNDTRNTYASLFCTSNPFLLLRPAFLCTVSEHPGLVGTTRNRESKVRACAEVHSTIQLWPLWELFSSLSLVRGVGPHLHRVHIDISRVDTHPPQQTGQTAQQREKLRFIPPKQWDMRVYVLLYCFLSAGRPWARNVCGVFRRL